MRDIDIDIGDFMSRLGDGLAKGAEEEGCGVCEEAGSGEEGCYGLFFDEVDLCGRRY